MADEAAMAEIRGIDINKLVEGFADIGVILKKYVRVVSTNAREIRWYQKTSGSASSNFLSSPTTTGITTDMIETSSKALPVAIENSYTRNTSNISKLTRFRLNHIFVAIRSSTRILLQSKDITTRISGFNIMVIILNNICHVLY